MRTFRMRVEIRYFLINQKSGQRFFDKTTRDVRPRTGLAGKVQRGGYQRER